jgi:hypothetical protein
MNPEGSGGAIKAEAFKSVLSEIAVISLHFFGTIINNYIFKWN